MPPFDVSSPALALGTAAVAGFGAGILPIGMAEALALAIGVVEPPELAVAMWLVFTATHVLAKVPWYWLGAHSDRVMGAWAMRYTQRARAFLDERPAFGTGLLAVSALTSVPPFHLASIAAGMTRIPFARFLVLCFGGRLVRFGLLVLAPEVVRRVLG